MEDSISNQTAQNPVKESTQNQASLDSSFPMKKTSEEPSNQMQAMEEETKTVINPTEATQSKPKKVKLSKNQQKEGLMEETKERKKKPQADKRTSQKAEAESKGPRNIYILPHQSKQWKSIKDKLEFLTSKPVEEEIFYSALREMISIHQGGKQFKKNFVILKEALASYDDSLNTLIPFMASIALQAETLFPGSLPILCQNETKVITLSKLQCACLMFHMFFCTTEKQGNKLLPSHCSLLEWYSASGDAISPKEEAKLSKIKCFLNYADRMKNDLTAAETERISYERVSLDPKIEYGVEFWKSSCEPLGEVIISDGSIHEAKGLLQVDFADMYIGGLVLTIGCAQEEIMFLTAPEHFPSILFTECLLPQEALLIKGAQEYNKSTGYGQSFRFAGNHQEKELPLDSFQRRDIITVAIDAIDFRKAEGDIQYSEMSILRELNKALAGFQGSLVEKESDKGRSIATGKWGCGVFKGDPQLKLVIQWISASKTLRPMIFYPFGDNALELAQLVVKKYKGKTIGELFCMILLYIQERTKKQSAELFEYLLAQ